MITVLKALRRAVTDKAARLALVLGALFGVPLYLVTLPASLTGGRVSLTNIEFLTPGMTILASALGILLGLILALMVFLLREGQRASGGLASSGFFLGIVTPLLCCSPILPMLLGLVAIAFPALANTAAGPFQAFIARHETALLLVALALMVISLHQNARRVVQGPSCRVKSG